MEKDNESAATPLTPSSLEEAALEGWLAGHRTAQAIVSFCGLPADQEESVRLLLRSKTFLRRAVEATQIVDMTILGWLRRRGLKYAVNMDSLADRPDDPRVQFQANKDLLDRLGTGATQKVQVTTPDDWKRLAREFSEPEKGPEVVAGLGDTQEA